MQVEEVLPSYLGVYDIVLVGDGDLNFVTDYAQALITTEDFFDCP